MGFHCKIFFPIVLRHRSWGVPFGKLEKLNFKNNITRNWSFRGPVFWLKRSSLGTSDIQGCYTPKRKLRIWYIPLYRFPELTGFWLRFALQKCNLKFTKRKNKGRKRRECQWTPAKEQYVNNFWIRTVQRNGFPKLTCFWLHLTLKKAIDVSVKNRRKIIFLGQNG